MRRLLSATLVSNGNVHFEQNSAYPMMTLKGTKLSLATIASSQETSVCRYSNIYKVQGIQKNAAVVVVVPTATAVRSRNKFNNKWTKETHFETFLRFSYCHRKFILLH